MATLEGTACDHDSAPDVSESFLTRTHSSNTEDKMTSSGFKRRSHFMDRNTKHLSNHS